jgi:uncharacterized protein
MAGEENLEKTKRAYAAFSSGDAEAAMQDLADDIEWITPGNSAISGTIRGKQEVGGLWGKFLEQGFKTSPQYWFADDERVVVLTRVTLGGQEADEADVLTFRGGQVVKFQSAADTALLEQVYGSK